VCVRYIEDCFFFWVEDKFSRKLALPERLLYLLLNASLIGKQESDRKERGSDKMLDCEKGEKNNGAVKRVRNNNATLWPSFASFGGYGGNFTAEGFHWQCC